MRGGLVRVGGRSPVFDLKRDVGRARVAEPLRSGGLSGFAATTTPALRLGAGCFAEHRLSTGIFNRFKRSAAGFFADMFAFWMAPLFSHSIMENDFTHPVAGDEVFDEGPSENDGEAGLTPIEKIFGLSDEVVRTARNGNGRVIEAIETEASRFGGPGLFLRILDIRVFVRKRALAPLLILSNAGNVSATEYLVREIAAGNHTVLERSAARHLTTQKLVFAAFEAAEQALEKLSRSESIPMVVGRLDTAANFFERSGYFKDALGALLSAHELTERNGYVTDRGRLERRITELGDKLELFELAAGRAKEAYGLLMRGKVDTALRLFGEAIDLYSQSSHPYAAETETVAKRIGRSWQNRSPISSNVIDNRTTAILGAPVVVDPYVPPEDLN